ncbi:hypothetical protein [Ruminococcus sp.]|jgi:hypothetical protein|uniref:SecDF P1 head subdomain-containing protein n=1 Tax=Ruminococcus sp. TaxID=41978 RepID=UPI0025FCBEB1|nr:hypothetical protein [Ruminococcus sp.]
MKDNNKEVDFGIIENAELSELESLSEKVAPVSSDDKKKILEMSKRKFNIRNNDITDHNEDTVSGSEPYRPRTMWKIFASVAACAVIVGGIAGGAALLHRNGGINGSDVESTTVTEEPTSLPGDVIEQHEVFFRKGDSPESPVVLTGKSIKKASMSYMPDANGDGQYVINGELDQEGADIFSQVTAELAGTGTPISIWVDGECVSAPTVNSSILNGRFMITGNFDAETAQALADKLSNCNTAYGETADGLKYGDAHADLIGQCMDEFIDNADDNITDAFYCEYDINGDNIPELFIQYHTDDPESPFPNVSELYSLQNGKYQKLEISSKLIQTHFNNKDGIIISQCLEDFDKHQIYKLNDDGSITLLYEFKMVVEDQNISYSINGEKCSEEEWNKKFNEIVTDDVEYLDELTKEFYQKY